MGRRRSDETRTSERGRIAGVAGVGSAAGLSSIAAGTAVLAMLALFAACGEADDVDRESPEESSAAEVAEEGGAIASGATSGSLWYRFAAGRDPGAAFVCPPCPVHDVRVFREDGTCPVCGLELIERPDLSPVGEVDIHAGSGNFVLRGGPGREEALIVVFYHRPERFTARSPVLIVVPGAGRNANEYRDAWVEASEAYGVLVLSPMYAEADYGFGAYHMGGLMYDLNLDEAVEYVDGSNEALLDEAAFRYRVNENRNQWIFEDFDRIFERAARAVGSPRGSYDLFGHSAGAQILHRLVLLDPHTEADRLLAANAGFYTMPDLDATLPFGLTDAPVAPEDLRRSFGERLVLFLGADDDADETGGTLLRSPSADRQGAHRLERGRRFYRAARRRAADLGTEFEWRLEVIPGVGHDFRRMSRAAAEYLYGAGLAGSTADSMSAPN